MENFSETEISTELDHELNHLPESWVLTSLKEIGLIFSGGTPSTAVPEYWNGDVVWVTPADLSGYNQKTIHKGGKSISRLGLAKSSAKLLPPGTILFSSRAPIGYVAIAGRELCTNQGFKNLIPSPGIDNDFLYFFLKFSKKQATNLASGTTFKEISATNFAKILIPVPPSAEQKRIVAKIEELFSRLDAGVDSLKKAQAQLKTYRQAVLKWAFEGKLTNPCLMDKELPERWQKLILENIAEKVQIGPFGSQLHKEDYIENGIPLINPMHIHSGEIVPDYSFSILPEKRDSLPNYILQVGDIIMGRRGEMGRCGLVQEKENGWFCGTGSLYIRPKKHQVSPKFLHFFLSSFEVKKYLEENAAGTTMANLNKKIIHNIPIHLPSLKEQTSIIAEIEKRLSVCDKLEESIAQSLKQAEALKQSILKKAFEGKLVPQNPDDEPASVLLGRIRSEREKPGAVAAKDSAIHRNRKKHALHTNPSEL